MTPGQEKQMVKASAGTVDRRIRTMVSRIVKKFDPERIILFGSRAGKNARPDSDVDLLVVMDAGRTRRDAELALRKLLHDIPVPKDVIVSRPEDFAWRKDIVGTIEYPATREGKVLYTRRLVSRRLPGSMYPRRKK